MSIARFSRLRWLRIACASVLLWAGCGPRDRFFHGARVLSDGSAVEVAALMPNCGCMTLSMHATENQPPAGQQAKLRVRAFFREAPVGQTDIEAGTRLTERYDWAGIGEDDRYEVRVVRMEGDKEIPVAIPDYLAVTSTETPCAQVLCGYGELMLNQAVNRRLGQNDVDARERGVHETSGGQLIEAAATPGTCGCMILLNTGSERDKLPLRVEATLNGTRVGVDVIQYFAPTKGGPDSDQHRTYVVGFDSAGNRPEDRYVLGALELVRDGAAANGQKDPPGTTGTSQISRKLSIDEYVTIVGQIDQLDCTSTGARFRLPAYVLAQGVDGTRPAQDQVVECPFGALNMNKMTPAAINNQAAAPTAIQPSDVPPAPAAREPQRPNK